MRRTRALRIHRMEPWPYMMACCRVRSSPNSFGFTECTGDDPLATSAGDVGGLSARTISA